MNVPELLIVTGPPFVVINAPVRVKSFTINVIPEAPFVLRSPFTVKSPEELILITAALMPNVDTLTPPPTVNVPKRVPVPTADKREMFCAEVIVRLAAPFIVPLITISFVPVEVSCGLPERVIGLVNVIPAAVICPLSVTAPELVCVNVPPMEQVLLMFNNPELLIAKTPVAVVTEPLIVKAAPVKLMPPPPFASIAPLKLVVPVPDN